MVKTAILYWLAAFSVVVIVGAAYKLTATLMEFYADSHVADVPVRCARQDPCREVVDNGRSFEIIGRFSGERQRGE